MSRPEATQKTFYNVQALRAVAALMVVAHHAIICWRDLLVGDANVPLPWENGAAGVDIFFVISGFVMAVSLPGGAGGTERARSFLRRRLVRIVPLYWCFTTLKLLHLWWSTPPGERVGGGWWHVVASYLFIPSMDGYGLSYPLLPVGWTLTFEMLFYGLFAVALALEVVPLAFLAPTLGLAALAGWSGVVPWPVFLVQDAPLVLEFLFGVILGQGALRGRLPGGVWAVALLAGGFAAISVVPVPHAWRTFAWGLPAAAVVAGALALEGKTGRRLPRWLLEAGNASYAIYLVHLPVLAVLWPIMRRLGRTGDSALVEVTVYALGLSLLAGEAVHRWIELPLLRWTRITRALPGVNTLPLPPDAPSPSVSAPGHGGQSASTTGG